MANYFKDFPVKKLLIIRLSSLGDILLTTPLVRSIKEQNPGISVDFLLREEYSEVFSYNPHISSLLFYNGSLEEVSSLIKARNYDLILDLQNNFRSFQITRGLKVPVLKFGKKHINKFLLVRFKINKLKDAGPIPLRYAETVPGLELDKKGLEVFSATNSAEVQLKGNTIGFCPGSRHFTKMWPEEYFIELGCKLSSKGYKILLFGGKSDKDICNRLSESIPGARNLCNDNRLLLTAELMKECSCIVCNDSGLMHLACAVNVPVVTIFGSSVKEFGFIPYTRAKSLILENNLLSCRPCSHIGREECPLKHFRCMREIVPELVLEKIEDLIKE